MNPADIKTTSKTCTEMKNHSAALNATLNLQILLFLFESCCSNPAGNIKISTKKLFSCTQSAFKLENPIDLKIGKNQQQNETPLSCIQCA